MEGKTHFSLGVATGVGMAIANPAINSAGELALTVVAASLGAILPDIDSDGSIINNFMFPSFDQKFRSFALVSIGVVMVLLYFLQDLPLWVLFAGVFAARVAYARHRTVTHSILALLYVTWTAYLIAPPYALAVGFGYLSHLVADTFTAAGVPYLWPIRYDFGFKGVGIKIESGGPTDHLVGKVAIVAASVGLVYLVGFEVYSSVSTFSHVPNPLTHLVNQFTSAVK